MKRPSIFHRKPINRRSSGYKHSQQISQQGKSLFSKIGYTHITSTLAFAISALTLYYSWFYVHHSVKLAVVKVWSGIYTFNSPLNFDFAVLNQGNQTEILFSMKLMFRFPMGDEVGAMSSPAADTRLSEKGPYILKPGEVLPVHLEWDVDDTLIMDLKQIMEKKDMKTFPSGTLILDVDTLSSQGSDRTLQIALGRVDFNVDTPIPNLKQNKLFTSFYNTYDMNAKANILELWR